MTEPKHCTCYADHAWRGTVAIDRNEPLAEGTRRLRLDCPEIARRIVPGQFVMLRLAGQNDPLLGRALALYDVVDETGNGDSGIDVVYLVVGKMTRRLAMLPPGSPIEIWGPLGNGFPPGATEHLVMVAGGIGQTPFLSLAREYLGQRTYGDPPRGVPRAQKVTLCYGARGRQQLAGLDDFGKAGVDVRLATEDGSAGHRGLVTELIEGVVGESALPCRLVCCGPEPMLKAVAQVANRLDLPCQVSLETPMACGIGICFSCVAKIRTESGEWDYRRTCVEGPVFDAKDVQF